MFEFVVFIAFMILLVSYQLILSHFVFADTFIYFGTLFCSAII